MDFENSMQTIHKADGFEAQKLLVLSDKLLEDISRHPLVKPLYVTDIGFFPSAHYHYRERPEGCDAAIFIYCTEGEGWVLFEKGRKIAVPANTLLVIPARTPHTYGATETDPWSIYWFHIKGEAVEAFIQCLPLSNCTVRIPTTQTIDILGLFNLCYETLLYKGYSWRYHLFVSQVMRHLLGSIALLRNETQQEGRKNEYIERSVHYMMRSIQASLTLDDLAEHVHLSKPHFIHLFKEVTGYTPIDYYMRLKIQQACYYLDLTDQTVKEVSRSVGMQDPYYFSRVFHKIMGLSPSEYREIKKG
jgi:AraC-like DNA-binding protein/mannose-6-phosphate isomerase-like protein (cupin superfamily)